jgi:indoleamine 2,3-dioxygenase
VNQGLFDHMKFLEDIENIFNKMWRTSIPRNFGNFRTFIMGIKGNDEIFPNGVIYGGEFDNKPQFYRGASGA